MSFYEIGDVVISDLSIRNKNTGAFINPADQIIQLNVYEDFNSPTLYAEAEIYDTIGMLHSFPLIGEEDLDISFQTPGSSYPTTYNLKIFSIENVQQLQNGRGYTYTIRCVSEEQLLQSNINITQSYNDTLDSVVQSIFSRYMPTNKRVDIDPCKGTETVVFPKVTPLTAIDILRKRAVHPSYVSSSFVFFENQDGFNFKCVEQLIEDGKAKIGTKSFYYYQDGQRDTGSEALMFRNIIDYENISRTDVTELIQDGGVKNRVRYFDIFTKSVKDITFDMTEKLSSIVSTDKSSSMNISDSMMQKYASNPTFNFYIPKDTDRKENFIEGMMGARQSFSKLFNSNILRLYIVGDSTIKAGDVINVNFAKAEGLTGGVSTDDPNNGNYIITRIRHILTTSGKLKHYISLDCNKVGLA